MGAASGPGVPGGEPADGPAVDGRGHLPHDGAAEHGAEQRDAGDPVEEGQRGQVEPGLLGGVADEHVDVRGHAVPGCLDALLGGQGVVAVLGAERHPAPEPEGGRTGLDLGLQRHHLRGRRPRGDGTGRARHRRGHRRPAAGDAQRRALQDGPAEQQLRARDGHEMGHGVAPGGLAEHGHPVRVAAEGRDVAPHPAQGL